MFTGIVAELGAVVRLEDGGDPVRLGVRAAGVARDLRPGDSVAVNGVCLTAVEVGANTFTADVLAETLRRSSLGALRTGDRVNLELAVQPTSRLGGHLVQGHVDGVGTVLDCASGERADLLRIGLPASLARYLVEKGSICVDGVSLTVVDVEDTSFTVALIPTTRRETVLGAKVAGDPVNLEVDVIAKYVERLLAYQTERVG